jgi:ATP-dependent Clp protease adaptor protein ClpS
MKMQISKNKEVTFNQLQDKTSDREENEVIGIEKKCLILHNDDYHDFDFVINALIEICKHNSEQAEQCTFLVHYKGKCDVRSGQYSDLKPMKDALIDKGLNATIN